MFLDYFFFFSAQYDEWFRKRSHSSPEIIHGTKCCNSELHLTDTRAKHRQQASLSTGTNIAREQHEEYSIAPSHNALNDCVPYFSLADDFSSSDAPDAWAAAGSMVYSQISPDMLPAVDVPGPDITDAWSSVTLPWLIPHCNDADDVQKASDTLKIPYLSHFQGRVLSQQLPIIGVPDAI